MRSTCSCSGLSLEANFQGAGSQINLMVRNPTKFSKGDSVKQILTGQLAKIKPKMVSNFANGIISLGQNKIYVDKKISRRRGSCSLQVSSSSNSPHSLNKGNNNKFLPSAYRVCTKKLDETVDFAEPSRIINDFDLDSDGEGLHSYLPFCSSSEDEEGEDGEELESQTSEAHEVQEENQMAILDDIRFLFNKDQENQLTKVQPTEEAKTGF